MLLSLPVNKFSKDFERSHLEPLSPVSQASWSSVRRNSKGLTSSLLQAYEERQEEERKSKQEFQRASFNVYGSVSHDLEFNSLSINLNRFQRTSRVADGTLDGNPYAIEGRILL